MLQQRISTAAEGTAAAQLPSSMLLDLATPQPGPEKKKQATSASAAKTEKFSSSSSSEQQLGKKGTSQKAKGPLIVELDSTSDSAAAQPCEASSGEAATGGSNNAQGGKQLKEQRQDQQRQQSSRLGQEGCHTGLGSRSGQLNNRGTGTARGAGQLLRAGFLTQPPTAVPARKQQQQVCKEDQGLPPPRCLQPQKIKAGTCKSHTETMPMPASTASVPQATKQRAAAPADTAACLDVLALASLFTDEASSCCLECPSTSTPSILAPTAAAGARAALVTPGANTEAAAGAGDAKGATQVVIAANVTAAEDGSSSICVKVWGRLKDQRYCVVPP